MEPGRLERILDPSFLDDLDAWPTARLREQRWACEAEEEAVSYARRLLQGRLDILRAELLRRREAGSDAADDLLAGLARVLADPHDETRADVLHARPTRLRVPANAAHYEGRIDGLASERRLIAIEHEDLASLETLIEELASYERELSSVRRQLFDRIDALRAELAERYRDGRATVRDLLGGESH